MIVAIKKKEGRDRKQEIKMKKARGKRKKGQKSVHRTDGEIKDTRKLNYIDMRIAVIGAGWFGCHIAIELKNLGIDVDIFEAGEDIFLGASGINQYRLHLGFHYPRSYDTREQAKEGFNLFIAKYPQFSIPVKENVYAVAKQRSLIDFETYVQVMQASKLKFCIRDPDDFGLRNVTGCLTCNERLIDTRKAKSFFRTSLKDQLHLGVQVKELRPTNSSIMVNGELYDFAINCTYATYQPPETLDLCYEPCVMFLYEGEPNHPAITIMDGPFFSIYPYQEKLYTVSSVTYTPMSRCSTFEKAQTMLNNVNSEHLNALRKSIESEVHIQYPTFGARFEFADSLFSIKTKLNDATETRVCVVLEKDRVIHVVPGKIDSIFYAAQEVLKILNF